MFSKLYIIYCEFCDREIKRTQAKFHSTICNKGYKKTYKYNEQLQFGLAFSYVDVIILVSHIYTFVYSWHVVKLKGLLKFIILLLAVIFC